MTFGLLPRLGIELTAMLMTAINLTVALIAWRVRAEVPAGEEEVRTPRTRPCCFLRVSRATCVSQHDSVLAAAGAAILVVTVAAPARAGCDRARRRDGRRIATWPARSPA